jgi:putative membrane protein
VVSVGLDAFPFHFHPEVLGVIVALVGAYVYGLRRLGPRLAPAPGPVVSRTQVAWFSSGVILYFAFEWWPLHDIAEQSLYSVHMVQHLVLTFVVPPALLKGTPSWLLSHLLRPALPVLRFLTKPLIALLLFNAALAWLHAPGVVAGMLDDAPFHLLAHVIVVVPAFLMWWPILGPIPELPRLSPPAAMGYLFLQSLVPLIPASFLTFATEPVYGAYVGTVRLWGIDVLQDQRVAGLIMKIGGGALLWLAITVIFFKWAGEEERAAARERLAVRS